MKKKLFVGNLPWKATEDSLKALFAAHGNVISVKVVVDSYTGKSRGFGFVEMETEEGAQAAIRELDNKPYLERNLRVSLAQERTDQPNGNHGGGGGRDRGEGGPRRPSNRPSFSRGR